MTVTQLIEEVESFGGAFKVENYFGCNARLLYRLGQSHVSPELAARLDKVVCEHREEIARLVLAREWLIAWRPAGGLRVQ